ncbi:DNRLRE domain-containing protein [Streptosporangium minutum]|uniref:DNRLRE domain-containing protein n=1 Tax=Streptosporangium minutum TaxID=569862 RepID=UPI0013FDFA4A|nr:DNRLRE domain-containing protein [Streptosporangium minutum]
MDKVVEAAKKKAHESGKRVEIPSRKTESTTVFANPDGKTLRMELHTQPIRVKKAKGEGFTPIDTTLVEKNGVIKPKAVKGDLTLSAGENTVLLKSKTERGTAEIAAPGKLPEPKLTGSTATYPSVYGEGVDLVVTATATGFRQRIVIRERPSGPMTFRLPVDLPKSMSYGTNATGQPILLAEDGKKTVAEVRPALVLDAVAADPNGPIDAGKVGKAPVSVEQDGSALVFTPDPAFLADPAVTYPVTMNAASSAWVGAALADDTFVNSLDYQDGWYNSDLDRTLVGKSNGGAVTWRTYLKFNVAVPELENAEIYNADLMLWNYLSNTCGSQVGSGIVARRITTPWDVYNLTWNNQPSTTTEYQVVNPAAYSSNCSWGEGELLYSVEDIVRSWAGKLDPDYGFQLRATSESDATNWRRYRSKEGGSWNHEPNHAPILFIDYTPAEKALVHFSESGPERTTAPSYAEALTLSQETEESVPVLPAVTENELLQLDEQGGDPYPVESENRQPLEGEDWTTVDPEMDEFAPKVIEVSPPDKAVEVAVGTTVRVTFNEPVTGVQVSLKDPAGTAVEGTSTIDTTGKAVTFTPNEPLSPGLRYTAEASEAEDGSGNLMDPYPWSFTTAGGIAAHWPLDEGANRNAADSSGNDHDATLNDTATWVAGRTGNALSNTPPSQLRATASQEAVKTGRPAEVTGETSETSITYAQPDGKTFTTEVAAGPVRARQGDRWVPIDASLAAQGGVLKPKTLAHGAAVEVSTGGTDAFVKMTADGQSYALRWPTVLPKPTLSKNVATFTDAAGRGADLVVTVLPTGFRHDVVLRERPARPLELRIGVETGGLILTEDKGGRLLLTGGKGKKLVASAPQPVMWDASAGARLARGRLPQARHAKIATDVVTRDGHTELVLKPDHAFLSDPATTYPVRVDPTTTLPFNHDVQVSTDVDLPTDPTEAFLMAGTQTGSRKLRVHLRFDTAALTGATVSDAKLSLNNIDAPSCGAAVGAGIQVRRLTGAWDENNLSWTNKPASTTEDAQINKAAINQDCATWPGSMDWNVTGIAQDWAGGAANHGVVLQSPTETNVDNYRVFTSSEDTDFATPPKLTVTTTGPASAPAISALTVTPAQVVAGTTMVTSLTPQLTATVTDTIGGTLTGQFEIEHDPAATGQGTGQIWVGASAAVTSGTQATAAVPAGKLTDGWKVRWRARAANTAASTTSAWSAWQMATIDVPGPISEPTVGALQVTPSTVVDGTTVTSSLTPNLLAQVSDPAGGSLRAEYEIEHDPAVTGQGTGQIWTGAVDNIASGTQASIAVPAGKLTDGWKVRWRARAVAGPLSSAWPDWQQVTIDVVQPGEEPLARTAGPVIRTDQSFTVAAWLKWSDKDGNYTVVEQKGTHQAPFRLGNTPDRGLVFTFTSADIADATTEGVLSDVEPPVNEWFHLAGVYNATAKTATLYLNGSPIKTGPVSFSTWNADTAMTLGTSMRGDLDDARVYQRPLSADQITNLVGVAFQPFAEPTSPAQTEALATGAFDYKHMSLEACEAERDARTGTGFKSRAWDRATPYSACWSRHEYFMMFEMDKKTVKTSTGTRYERVKMETDGQLHFDATVVINTYLGTSTGTGIVGGGSLGPRSIKVFTKIDDLDGGADEGVADWFECLLTGCSGKFEDDDLDRVLGLRVDVQGGTNACTLTSGSGYQGTLRRDNRISQWLADSRDEFVLQSHAERVSSCTIRPWITFDDPTPGIDPQSVALWGPPGTVSGGTSDSMAKRLNSPAVKCDNLPMWNNKGGCIISGASRIYEMATLDLEVGAVAQHINLAFTTPQNTVPLKAGKIIPGNWGRYANGTPREKPLRESLHRIQTHVGTKPTVKYKANVDRKNEICKEFFEDRRTRKNGETNELNLEDCDEFPFASTEEGAAYVHPQNGADNFSILALNHKQNEAAGTDLNVFYSRYRVLAGDPFWLLIK